MIMSIGRKTVGSFSFVQSIINGAFFKVCVRVKLCVCVRVLLYSHPCKFFLEGKCEGNFGLQLNLGLYLV